VGDRNAKAKLEVTEITESKFADDAALYAVTRKAVECSDDVCNNGSGMGAYC